MHRHTGFPAVLTALAAIALSACSGGQPPSPASAGGTAKGVQGQYFYVNVFAPPVGGYVTSDQGGISCGASSLGTPTQGSNGALVYSPTWYGPPAVPATTSHCGTLNGQQTQFAWGATVILTATPVAPNVFLGWAGDCGNDTGNTCTLTAGLDKSVVAIFGQPGTSHPNFLDPARHGAAYVRQAFNGQPLACTSCHGGSLGGSGIAPSCSLCHAWPLTPSHHIGGTVAGLAGSGLTLATAGQPALAVAAAANAFTFANAVYVGTDYAVTVLQQPTSPAQACTVKHGTGTVAAGNVTDVAVDCSAVFGAPQSYTTGTYPETLARGDLNRDGRLDLAVTNFNSNTLSILVGNGDGTFRAKVDYPTGSNPLGVAVGDFNGDGRPDVVVANYSSNTVGVYLGNGDGTLGARVDYLTGARPYGIVVGDFNGDGRLDIAVTAYSTNTVGILLGRGDGTFNARTDFATGSGPTYVTAGDFDKDGHLDLAVSNDGANTTSVLLGNGDGTFRAKVDYATGSYPYGVAAADLDGDGALDLAVVNYGTSNVSVLLGVGDGSFRPAVNYPTGGGPGGVTVGDFDGDGRLDLAVADFSGQGVGLLLGRGDGSFYPPVIFPVGGQLNDVVAGDFNGDGMLDVVVANYSGGGIGILLNQRTP